VSTRPKGRLAPVLSSRRKASPGAYPSILNYDTYVRFYYLCIKFRNCLKP